MHIRPAQLTDAEQLALIYNDAVLNTTATFDTEPKTAENRIEWLQQHTAQYPVLVGEIDGQVIGYASMSQWSDRQAYSDTAEISIYLKPEFQGRGYGTLLMSAIVKKGGEAGLHCVLSRITQGNTISIQLHEKAGFTTIGVMREVGKKFGQLLDVTMMQLIYP